MSDERLTLTVEEAGELLGVSRGVAYAAVKSGDIPSVRICRRIVVPRARLLALLGDLPASNGTKGGEHIEEASGPAALASASGRGDLGPALENLENECGRGLILPAALTLQRSYLLWQRYMTNSTASSPRPGSPSPATSWSASSRT